MKKFEKKQLNRLDEFISIGGARINCVKFGPKTSQVICGGDSDNQVLLWRLKKSNPLINFTGHTSEVTCCSFNQDESGVFSGSAGGTVIYWDLAAKREAAKLTGHLSACTSVSPELYESSKFVATGSQDTNAKLWDLRIKDPCVQTFKGHSKPVTCVEFSPDGKWICSGSKDGTIKVSLDWIQSYQIWDISTAREIKTLQMPDQEVTCLQFDPFSLSMANGSSDKSVKYYDLKTFELVTRTSSEMSPIVNLFFDQNESSALLAASSENIRVWDIENGNLLDVIQVPQKGISDFRISDVQKYCLVACLNLTSFNLYGTPQENINFDAMRMDMDSFGVGGLNSASPPSESFNENIPTKQVSGYSNEPVSKRPSSGQVSTSSNQPKKQMSKVHSKDDQSPPVRQPRSEKIEEQKQRFNPTPQSHLDQSDFDPLGQSVIPAPGDTPLGLDMSQFKNQAGQVQDEQNQKDIQTIQAIQDNHKNLMTVINRRVTSLNVILNWWAQGNISSAINALSMMNDASIVNDVLNHTFASGHRIDALTFDNLVQVLPHCHSMIAQKYESHMITGVKAAQNILKTFSKEQQIIQLLTVKVSGGVDLAREDRMQKCRQCVEEFRKISSSNYLKKLLNRKQFSDQNLKVSAQQLASELVTFLGSVDQ